MQDTGPLLTCVVVSHVSLFIQGRGRVSLISGEATLRLHLHLEKFSFSPLTDYPCEHTEGACYAWNIKHRNKATRDLERKVGDPLFISFCCELNGQRRWNWAHLCHRATYESVQPQESDVARELIMLKYFSLCSDLLANYTAPACNTHSITMISNQGFWNAVGKNVNTKFRWRELVLAITLRVRDRKMTKSM